MTAAALVALAVVTITRAVLGQAATWHAPAARNGEACAECGLPHLPGPCAPRTTRRAPTWARQET